MVRSNNFGLKIGGSGGKGGNVFIIGDKNWDINLSYLS